MHVFIVINSAFRQAVVSDDERVNLAASWGVIGRVRIHLIIAPDLFTLPLVLPFEVRVVLVVNLIVLSERVAGARPAASGRAQSGAVCLPLHPVSVVGRPIGVDPLAILVKHHMKV